VAIENTAKRIESVVSFPQNCGW